MDKDEKLLNDFLRGKRTKEMLTDASEPEQLAIPESVAKKGIAKVEETSAVFKIASLRHIDSSRLRHRPLSDPTASWAKPVVTDIEPVQHYIYIEDFEFLIPIDKKKFADPDYDLTPDIVNGIGFAGHIFDQEFLRGMGHVNAAVEGVANHPEKKYSDIVSLHNTIIDMEFEVEPQYRACGMCVMDTGTYETLRALGEDVSKMVLAHPIVVVDANAFAGQGPIREYFDIDFEDVYRLRKVAEEHIRDPFIHGIPSTTGYVALGDFNAGYRAILHEGAGVTVLPVDDEKFVFAKAHLRLGGGIIRERAFRVTELNTSSNVV